MSKMSWTAKKEKLNECMTLMQNNYGKKKKTRLLHIKDFIVSFSLPHVSVVHFEPWRIDTSIWTLLRLKLLSQLLLFLASIFYFFTHRFQKVVFARVMFVVLANTSPWNQREIIRKSSSPSSRYGKYEIWIPISFAWKA